MNRTLSLTERIHNCAATQEVEFCHATHTYLHAKAWATEEWSRIWAHGNPDPSCYDTASWAHAFGRMRGWKSVWHGSVTLYDGKAFTKWLDRYEESPEFGGLDPRPLMEVSMHTLATDIVEVADDGRSARASFLTPGNIGSAVGGKRHIGGLWERYGADFVYEDERWLFLHEQVCPDIDLGCDSGNVGQRNYEMMKRKPDDGPRGKPPASALKMMKFQPDCEDKGPLHKNWSCVQPVQDTVPWPEPYRTLDNENSYTKNW